MLFLLLSLVLGVGEANAARSVNEDRCQQRCVREQSAADGSWKVACSCERRGFRNPAAESSPPCLGALASRERDADELRATLARGKQSLCECVAARVRFPVYRQCTRSQSGESYCRFSPDLARPSVVQALRRPTADDIHSCAVASANYEGPSTCRNVRCASAKPFCGEGTELVNIAEPDACCPIFVCRPAGA